MCNCYKMPEKDHSNVISCLNKSNKEKILSRTTTGCLFCKWMMCGIVNSNEMNLCLECSISDLGYVAFVCCKGSVDISSQTIVIQVPWVDPFLVPLVIDHGLQEHLFMIILSIRVSMLDALRKKKV